MITVSYNAYCAITKEGDNDIWTVRPRGVVPLLPSCSQIDVGATVNALLGDTFSRENNTHRSRFHDRDPQFASRILGAMTQSCYIGTRDIRSRVIRGLYCICGGVVLLETCFIAGIGLSVWPQPVQEFFLIHTTQHLPCSMTSKYLCLQCHEHQEEE